MVKATSTRRRKVGPLRNLAEVMLGRFAALRPRTDDAMLGSQAAIGIAALLLIAGCSKPPEPEAKLRAIRVETVSASVVSGRHPLPAEVVARHDSKLAFRVGGKVLARHVDLGDRVSRGQVLARIDAVDLDHVRQSLAAQLAAARSEYMLSADEVSRHRELLDEHLISPVELDRRETAFTVARNRVAALEAQLAQAANQIAYATLRAEHAGVITAVAVEAGQVVSPGQPVMSLARLEEREVLVAIPEQELEAVRRRQLARVNFPAKPGVVVAARVREISAAADPASRTYAARLALSDAPSWVALGMTASVVLDSPEASSTSLPLAALFEPRGSLGSLPRVWVVDNDTQTVKSVRVELGRMLAGDRVEVSGLQPGQQVVTAGTSRLQEGDKVRVLADDAPVRSRLRGSR
jgi:multidrug efflux system membrane fusion protein